MWVCLNIGTPFLDGTKRNKPNQESPILRTPPTAKRVFPILNQRLGLWSRATLLSGASFPRTSCLPTSPACFTLNSASAWQRRISGPRPKARMAHFAAWRFGCGKFQAKASRRMLLPVPNHPKFRSGYLQPSNIKFQMRLVKGSFCSRGSNKYFAFHGSFLQLSNPLVLRFLALLPFFQHGYPIFGVVTSPSGFEGAFSCFSFSMSSGVRFLKSAVGSPISTSPDARGRRACVGASRFEREASPLEVGVLFHFFSNHRTEGIQKTHNTHTHTQTKRSKHGPSPHIPRQHLRQSANPPIRQSANPAWAVFLKCGKRARSS